MSCLKRGIYLQDVSLSEYQQIQDVIGPDIYEKLSSYNAVKNRHSYGGTGFSQVEEQVKAAQVQLQKEKEAEDE